PVPGDGRTGVQQEVVAHAGHDVARPAEAGEHRPRGHHALDGGAVGRFDIDRHRFILASRAASFSLPPAGGRQSICTTWAPWAARLAAKVSIPTLTAARVSRIASRGTGGK